MKRFFSNKFLAQVNTWEDVIGMKKRNVYTTALLRYLVCGIYIYIYIYTTNEIT
jgi:hypothetical protein